MVSRVKIEKVGDAALVESADSASLAARPVGAELLRQARPMEHPLLRRRERIENDIILNIGSPGSSESSLLARILSTARATSNQASQRAAAMVRSLLSGRIEHELRPLAHVLLSELSSLLSTRELALLQKSLLSIRPHIIGKNIQGIITALLRQCFEELELITVRNITSENGRGLQSSTRPDIFAGDDSNSHARVLETLRDLALHLATFLERSESDGISDLHELLLECQGDFQEKAASLKLSTAQVQTSQAFLQQVAISIFFEKLDLIAHDYLASGTDLSLVSGQVWASRYSRADYVPFLTSPVEELKQSHSWLFHEESTESRLEITQQKVKQVMAEGDRIIDQRPARYEESLESIVLEIRALFGIGLNCLVKDEGETALPIFERVLTLSADALEHPEQPLFSGLESRLSRIRVQAYFCCGEAEVSDARKRYSQAQGKDRVRLAENLLQKKSVSIRKALAKARYELQLLGLSGLPIDIDGTSHASLEGLGEWTQSILEREEALLLAELSASISKYESAFLYYASYLACMIGFELWEGEKFLQLNGTIKLDSRTGAQVRSGWRTKDLPSYTKSFVDEICERVGKLPSILRDRFAAAIPNMIATALEFEDFDNGFSLAVALRQLCTQLVVAGRSSPDFELLLGIVDAEVRFRFGDFLGSGKGPQESALSVLAECRKKESKGYFRDLDRKRELRLAQTVDDLSKTGALRDLTDFREMQVLREGIHGQFASQEIRMMAALGRLSRRKSLAKELYSLVFERIDQRLMLSTRERDLLLKAGEGSKESEKLAVNHLLCLDVETKALAAVQVLFDVALTCETLSEDKLARSLLQEALSRYEEFIPTLPGLVDNVFAARSVEEFRRRVEQAIRSLEKPALYSGISMVGAGTGASLAFALNKEVSSGLSGIFDNLAVIAEISRRKVVPGRCGSLEKFVISHNCTRLQRRLISAIVALNEGMQMRTKTR